MNTSELTEKALVLRRLADQFDNLALSQIELDNRRSELLDQFHGITAINRVLPPLGAEEATLRVPKAPRKYATANPGRASGIVSENNKTALAIIDVLLGADRPMHRDDIAVRIKPFPGTVATPASLSFYLSKLKQQGKITNPERGFWQVA